MEGGDNMARSKGITASKEAEESWKNCNVELFYDTLIKIIERRENVKITYTLRKKTEEELKAETQKDKQ